MKTTLTAKRIALGKTLAMWGVWAMLASRGGLILGQEQAQEPPQQGPVRSVEAVLPSAESGVEVGQGHFEKKRGETSMVRKPPAGRLPPYFASLVDSRQREAIYQIQSSMAEKIAELEKQLAELRQAEMREIEGVLSDEQRQRLEKLRAARRAETKQPSS